MTHISDTSEHGCKAASTDLLLDQVGPYSFLVFRRRILPPRRIPLRRRSLRVPCVGRRVVVGRGGVIAVARSGCSGSVSVSSGGLLDGHVRPAERVCLRSPCAALPVLGRSGVRRGERDGREMIAATSMATSTCRKLPATKGRSSEADAGRITAPRCSG